MKASEAMKHELVTTIGRHGGIGTGRLIGGEVYKTLGNGFYGLAKVSPEGLVTYHRDGGAKYRNAWRLS